MNGKQDSPCSFQYKQFATGLLVSAGGMAMIVMIAVRLLDAHGIAGPFAMPVVASSVICGIIMLGAGFAMMVVAAARDEDDGYGPPNSDADSSTGISRNLESTLPEAQPALTATAAMPEDQNVSRAATAVSDATLGNGPDLNPDRP
jgi:hypothetical protein